MASVETRRPAIVSSIVLLTSMLVVLAIVWAYREVAIAKDASRFDLEVSRVQREIEDRLEKHRTVLRGVAALFAVDENLPVARFRDYVQRLELHHILPGTLGVGFSRRVAAGDREPYERAQRQVYGDDFAIFPGHERDEYHVIEQLEPRSNENRVALGYDMFTEATRREAMQRACDSGDAAVSGPVTLVQEVGQPRRTGFLIYVPVYRFGPYGAVPPSVEVRRAALIGFAYSPLRASDYFDAAIRVQLPRMLDIEIWDGPVGQGALLYRPIELESLRVPEFTRVVALRDSERSHQSILFKSRREFEEISAKPFQIYLLGFGALISALFAILAWREMSLRASGVRQSRLLVAAEDRAHDVIVRSELRKSAMLNASLDCIITMDSAGRITDFNAAAERTFGHRSADVVGQSVADTIIPRRYRSAHWDGMRRLLATGQSSMIDRRIELEALRADGTEFPIEVSIGATRVPGEGTFFTAYLRDITERRAAQRDLEQSEARYRELVEQVQDYAIFRVSRDGEVLTWNLGVERVLGYGEDEFVGHSIDVIFLPEDVEAGIPAAERARAERLGRTGDDRWLRRKDGSRFWATSVLTAILDDDDAVVGFTRVLRDETAWKRVEEERDQSLANERVARVEIERISRLKDDFVATLSHELRTPLNAILGWTQILRRGGRDAADVAAGLETIERNARAQSQMIEDLLDMSRIISGKLRLHVQVIDLGEIVRDALESIRPAADAKQIELRADLQPVADQVSGDPARLQQVVWNLLSNAIKFTQRGGRVEVSVTGADSAVTVRVRDNGKGVDVENLAVIFERFRQEDASTTRRHGGLGLGLSIVKNLVELHGGSVQAHSDGEGCGAEFGFVLPARSVGAMSGALDDGQDAAGGELGAGPVVTPLGQAEGNELEGVRILVVDDDADSRAIVARLLSDRGAEVTMADSADDAMARFAAFRPDLLFSDIGMPGKDGYDLIRWIRKLAPEAGGQVPAAALTALARSQDRTQALRAGFQVHVAKPVEPSELVAVAVTLKSMSLS